MKVWVIAKLSQSDWWVGGVCICMRVCIEVGGMKICVAATLSVSESKEEFQYNIFWISSRELVHII